MDAAQAFIPSTVLLAGADVLGLRPASGSALAAALHKLDGSGKWWGRVRLSRSCSCEALPPPAGQDSQPWAPVDPLALAASSLAPGFISASERQTFFMGQVAGMEDFHERDFSGTRRCVWAPAVASRAVPWPSLLRP